MFRKLTFATILTACMALVQVGHAQSTFGDLRGLTLDPTGLPLPGADVTVQSLDENTTRQVTSGEDGAFVVENLKPGRYQLTATKQGFRTSTPVEADLSARQSLRVDITLALESKVTEIQVSAAAEQLNTENGTIGDDKVTLQLEESDHRCGEPAAPGTIASQRKSG